MNDQSTENENRDSEKDIDRRKFLMKLSLGFAAVSAAVAAIPVLSALVAPLLEQPTENGER